MNAGTINTVQVVKAPPFRADHVGSLLRPRRLKEARERILGPKPDFAPHDNAELRALEDSCILEVIAMQERVGLRAATDGEFRRQSFLWEMIRSWEGIELERNGEGTRMRWRSESGAAEGFTQMTATKRIAWRPSAVERAFKFLKAHTSVVPKVNIPAPGMIHYSFGGFDEQTKRIYPDLDAFWEDLIAAYRKELASLVAAGATYIQFDDVSFAFMCDPAHREHIASWGHDPEALLRTYAEKLNSVIGALPENVTTTLHTCRGNRAGTWAAEGGYDPVADVLFNQINVDGYFLEYDTYRAGGFEPLRLLPKGGKRVILGLMSSKTGELESVDQLKRRIDEAQRIAPLDQLGVSPQCGFSSSVHGNPLTEAEEEAKLARLVEVAREVWSSV
jgi:5-methyltetrahydropteroyltriglutamate--homocysteine methyltransferase